MKESNELLVSDDGPVRHLRFNRPERLNVIDLASMKGSLRNWNGLKQIRIFV